MEQENINVIEKSFLNVKHFAEILYKCKLCTSLPSILTSEDSFLNHMNIIHLQDSSSLKKCPNCSLKFRTKEDLWAHKKLMHSDFASDGEINESSSENEKFEIAWQITTDNADINQADSTKRKRTNNEKFRRKKKIKEEEEDIEQDPHIVITHGTEGAASPSTHNSPADLQRLTNQIASDASPGISMGNNSSFSCSTPEFGKYTKLIREGGNIVYFCQVCNWKTQMKIMFTEHCKSTAHLVKVAVAEQNDNHEKNPQEKTTQSKKGFMSFLDEKINFYINKRSSNESDTSPSKKSAEESFDAGNNDTSVFDVEVKQEPIEIVDDVTENSDVSHTLSQGSRRKRKITNRLIQALNDEKNESSDTSEVGMTSSNKVRKQSSENGQNNESTQKLVEANLPAEIAEVVAKSIANTIEHNNPNLYMYRCSLCPFVCNDITEYRVHFESVHEPEQTDTVEPATIGYTDYKAEQKKIQKIKDLLPNIVVAHPRGNVSRDLLLQKASVMYNEPEIALWGPACNKALREMFPDSVAQRKGKYKKYYFGVTLLEQVQDQDGLYTDGGDHGDADICPLRDMTQDMDKILQHLTDIVVWKGDLEAGVSRDDVLHILGRRIEDPDIANWGVQCNRAIRILFPNVQMKRKGKYKTVYFGVTFSENVTKEDYASLVSPRNKPQSKPSYKDDGIKPKLSWRDAIRTVNNQGFSPLEKKSTSSVTKGWGPMIGPMGASTASTSSQGTPSINDVPPNVTTDMLQNIPSDKDIFLKSPSQNMSLLRYHLTSSEDVNLYEAFGADLTKTVWQSKEQLEKAKEDAEKITDNKVDVKGGVPETRGAEDEKSNDADDENSQSTIEDGTSSSFFTDNSKDNPTTTIVETEDGIMYIKRELDSDEEEK